MEIAREIVRSLLSMPSTVAVDSSIPLASTFQSGSNKPGPSHNMYLQGVLSLHCALAFALNPQWSLLFSAGLGSVQVLLMDPDWSCGAG